MPHYFTRTFQGKQVIFNSIAVLSFVIVLRKLGLSIVEHKLPDLKLKANDQSPPAAADSDSIVCYTSTVTLFS